MCWAHSTDWISTCWNSRRSPLFAQSCVVFTLYPWSEIHIYLYCRLCVWGEHSINTTIEPHCKLDTQWMLLAVICHSLRNLLFLVIYLLAMRLKIFKWKPLFCHSLPLRFKAVFKKVITLQSSALNRLPAQIHFFFWQFSYSLISFLFKFSQYNVQCVTATTETWNEYGYISNTACTNELCKNLGGGVEKWNGVQNNSFPCHCQSTRHSIRSLLS